MTARKQKQESVPIEESIAPMQEGIEIDVSNITIPPPVKPSLKERLLGKSDDEPIKKPAPKKKGSKGTVDAERTVSVFRSVLPMTLAGLFAMQSKRWFKDPYKPCAPERDEVAEVLLPIFNFISRRIEISGKITQDAEDIAACIFASITLSIRMLITAQEIREYGQQLTPTERANIPDTGGQTSGRSGETGNYSNGKSQSTNRVPASATSYGHYTGQSVVNPQWGDAIVSGVDAADGTNGNGTWERAKVADLLRRDTLGRRQMGLAPRIFRDDG
jgi:hypothetical protein